MQKLTYQDIKVSLEQVLKQYHTAIAIILFGTGIFLRIYSTRYPNGVWQIVGEIGTFLAGVIAVPFIYDKFIKDNSQKIFLSELEEVLDSKLKIYRTNHNTLRIFERGRMPVHEKVDFFYDAKSEIFEFGLSLSTFVSFFEQRPVHDYKLPVTDMLRRGVKIKCLVLDPHSEIARLYADDRGEPNLPDKIIRAIAGLSALREEFANQGLKGVFEIYSYSHFPSCYILLVDPDETNGRAYVSHYLYATKRADTPILEIHKEDNPVLFQKYYDMTKKILETSKKL